MDKSKLTGLALIVALYLGFFYYSSQEQKKYDEKKAAYEAQIAKLESAQIEKVSELEPMEQPSAEDVKAKSIETIGESLTEARMADSRSIVLENEQMRVEFSTRGAKVAGVTLKEYTKYAPKGERTELIQMFDPSTSKMDMSFYIKNGYNNLMVNTGDYTFEALPLIAIDGAQQLTMRLNLNDGAHIDYIYTLYSGDMVARNYLLDFKVKMHNLTPILANQTSFVLNMANKSYQNERGFSNENTYTTVAYHYPGEHTIDELKMSTEAQNESVSTSVDWVAFKQQYFSSVIIAPNGGISNADLSFVTAAENSGYIKTFNATMTLPLTASTSEFDFGLYYGPNQYNILSQVSDIEGYEDLRLKELVPLGWGVFGWVNKFIVIPIFNLLRNHIASFGIIIFILSLFIKLLIAPLTYSSYISMAKMRVQATSRCSNSEVH